MNFELFSAAFAELIKRVYTCAPGHIITFDPALQRAQVRIGIESVDRNGATSQLPPIADVPVLFPGGTQFTTIHQINPGDEGLIVFSQRCVDGWKQTGGVANNPLARFHDTHDAFFIPGFRPLSTRISGFANDGIRMQSRDGIKHVWIKSSGDIELTNGPGSFKMQPDGKIVINGTCIINPDGTIEAPNVTFANISGKDHKHTGVVSGNQTSGEPTN